MLVLIEGEARGPNSWPNVKKFVVEPLNADVAIRTWKGPFSADLIDYFKPCSREVAEYDAAVRDDITAQYPWAKPRGRTSMYVIGDYETEYVVVAYYGMWLSSMLMRQVESHRLHPYRAVIRVRPDLFFTERPMVLPEVLEPGFIYMAPNSTDEQPDKGDPDRSPPITRGKCGLNPRDYMAIAEPATMHRYLGLFPFMGEVAEVMKAREGYTVWANMTCLNCRGDGFLNNQEGFLGNYMRWRGLGCKEIDQSDFPVWQLDPQRKKYDDQWE